MLKLAGWRYSNASGKLISLTTYTRKEGGSLVAQWLRLHNPLAGGLGSIPGEGTWSYMSQPRDAGTEDLPRCNEGRRALMLQPRLGSERNKNTNKYRKEETPQIDSPSFQLGKLQKEEQTKAIANRRENKDRTRSEQRRNKRNSQQKRQADNHTYRARKESERTQGTNIKDKAESAETKEQSENAMTSFTNFTRQMKHFP